MNYSIRTATVADVDAIARLLPRLADFELPPGRVAEHLWRGDEALLRRWGRGEAPRCVVQVAVDDRDAILGVALASLGGELLSREPSAHLEALAIDERADGHGIGQALLRAAEAAVRQAGARSMTLHVFASNARARHVYERAGYTGELIRCIKHFGG